MAPSAADRLRATGQAWGAMHITGVLLAFSRCCLQGSFQMRERIAAPLRGHHPTNSPRTKGGKRGKPRLICRRGKLAQPNAVLPLYFAGDFKERSESSWT